MNVILTLDYELFFGTPTGSVSNAMVGATDTLLKLLNEFNIKAVFFVDIGFVKKLYELKQGNPQLEEDYKKLNEQLHNLSEQGHDLQLHIHPHWEDSFYKNGKWEINANRYRLADWSDNKVMEIVSNYKQFLDQFCKNNSVFAYRAGGFSIQPFNKIKKALQENGIWLDSTVYKDEYNASETHFVDFRGAPSESSWYFEDDPLKPVDSGNFLEIPIAPHKISPLFFWKLALTRLAKSKQHHPFGDGNSLPASKKWIFKKMLLPSNVFVSIDGFKANYLESAFIKHKRNKNYKNFVILSHPKALTTYSLKVFRKFLQKYYREHDFETFSSLREKGVIKKSKK